MQRTIIYAIGIAIILIGGYLLLAKSGDKAPSVETNASYKDATYTIDGQSVTLRNGVSEVEAAPGSASKVTTRYFGNEAWGDLNADGKDDVAFIITENGGGTGTFFFVVAAVKTDTGYEGSDAVLLGDRIAPQTTEIRGGKIIVNYADRKPGEPMTAQPSVGESKVLILDPTLLVLGEVAQNFEGEADPARMTLTMKSWQWVMTEIGDEDVLAPRKPQAFSLTFNKDGTFQATTDCNSVGGNYTANAGKITFSKMMSTLMFCADSQETEFRQALENAKEYRFTGKGELLLTPGTGGAVAVFR